MSPPRRWCSASDARAAADWGGIVAALVMTGGFAAQLVAIRRHGRVDVLVLNTWAAALCVPVCLPFAHLALPPLPVLAGAACYGALTTGFAYILALEGGRRISPGEVGFISMLDVVLGPLWVWLAFAETPGWRVLAGGVLVLAVVCWYLWATRDTAVDHA